MEQKKVVKKVVNKPIQNKETLIDKIKRNWKNILLIILILFIPLNILYISNKIPVIIPAIKL